MWKIWITYFVLSILSCVALMSLQRLISRIFSPLPDQVRSLSREVERSTAAGDWYDDSDIDRLSREMMQAELSRPGSTFHLYYNNTVALACRLIGSVVISFISVGWILGIFPITIRGVVLLIFAALFLLNPYIMWFISRPVTKR